MIAVTQCFNCRELLRSWEKQAQYHGDNFERVIYLCRCGFYTAVSIKTSKSVKDLVPEPIERRK